MHKFGDAKREQALSKVNVKVQPGGRVAHLHVHAQETEGVLVLLSAKSLTSLEQSSTSRRVMRSSVLWNLKLWYTWNTVLRDIC